MGRQAGYGPPNCGDRLTHTPSSHGTLPDTAEGVAGGGGGGERNGSIERDTEQGGIFVHDALYPSTISTAMNGGC